MEKINNNPSETKDVILRKKEQELYERSFKQWDIEKFPNGHISYIQDDVFWLFIDKYKLSYYMKENWDLIFNVWQLRKDLFIKEAILWTWFFEKLDWDVYNLYQVLWFDKNDKPVLEKTPINQYSKEYFKAWEDIFFNDVLIWKTVLKKNPASMFSKEELETLERDILFKINTWAITIDDIEALYWLDKSGKQDKDLQKISEDFFKKAIKKIVEEKLLLQCGDGRLDEAKQWITQEKLVHYYNKGYISVGMAENCRAAIQRKVEKKQSGSKIGDTTEKKLDELKK